MYAILCIPSGILNSSGLTTRSKKTLKAFLPLPVMHQTRQGSFLCNKHAWVKAVTTLQKGNGFAVPQASFHWGFMVASALLTAFGFVTIFVANYNNQTTLPGLISFSCGKSITHFVFGLLVVTLQCLNIMVSFCRCNPESPHRWIYNLVHGNVIGLATWILALSNAGIGVAIFEDDRGNVPTSGYKIVWLYVGFLAFLLILNGILLLSFALSARKPGTFEEYLQIAPSIARYFARFKMLNRTVDQNAKKQGIEMSNLVIDEDKKEEIVEVKNMMINSLDTKLRLIGTALLLVVSTILTVTLSGMIVAAKE